MLAAIALFAAVAPQSAYDLYWQGETFDPAIQLDRFHLAGSDGRQNTVETLTNGEPVLLFNFEFVFSDYVHQVATGLEYPNRVADLNRLARLTKNSMRVVGLTRATMKDNKRLAKKYGIQFLLLGQDGIKEHDFDGEGLYQELQLDGGMFQGAIGNLQNALILPNGKLLAIWPGYSRASLTQVKRMVRRYTGKQLSLDVSKFPRRRQVGRMGLYGEPGEGPGHITPEQGKSGAMAEWYQRQERWKKAPHVPRVKKN